MSKEEEKKISMWWVFVPIFLGAAGGWFAWQAHKKKEKEMARMLLVIGLVFTVIILLLYIWLIFGVYVPLVHL
jgi:cytochrome bd-type quinol oxidase subunit 1